MISYHTRINEDQKQGRSQYEICIETRRQPINGINYDSGGRHTGRGTSALK